MKKKARRTLTIFAFLPPDMSYVHFVVNGIALHVACVQDIRLKIGDTSGLDSMLRTDRRAEVAMFGGAARTHMLRRILRNLCVKPPGLSAGKLVRRERIEHAKHLLSETDRSVPDINVSCGF